MLRAFLLVGLGGAVGSMARYGCFLAISNRRFGEFPFATLTVNLLGCLLFGVLVGLSQKWNIAREDLMLILATGFCGGFTTFSAFAGDSLSLVSKNMSVQAVLYASLSVVLGLLLCRAGIWLSSEILD